MLNSSLSLVIALVVIVVDPGLSIDYCSKKLCREKKHIRCGNDGSFGKDCPANAEVVPMTAELKKYIVDTHNEIRRNVIEGRYPDLKSANRMIQMEYLDELAENAEYTAKTCLYKHDECRNTPTYVKVGQNMAMYAKKSSATLDYLQIIKKIIESWLSQEGNVAQLVERYSSEKGGAADDFLQMIRASCGHVGCAMVHFVADGKHNVFLVCNYSSANIPNEPIYEIGPACSACVTGCSTATPGLCKTEEERYFLLELKLLNLIDVDIKDPLKLKKTLGKLV